MQKKELQDPLRFNFIHELNKVSLNNKENIIKKSTFEMKIIASISEKLKIKGAIITKADKGNTTVIINKDDYNEKVKNWSKTTIL
jgi:hypothetical protein